MRVAAMSGGLKVHAVAGTYVVLLGFDLPKRSCKGLRGFAIHRRDHTENEAAYLTGMKCFAETDPGFQAGAHYSTRDHPIQGFQWSDYSAKPGHRYTYTVASLKGPPSDLEVHREVSVEVTTESPEGGDHDVYFNRGVSASQEYARRFGDRRPEDVPNGAAFTWLSRGLVEAMEDYVRSIKSGQGLRIAAYEFNHAPFLAIVRDAVDRGVDVQIVYDARNAKVADRNRASVSTATLEQVCRERTQHRWDIAHNKFMVRLEGGKAVSVWTGGTNFSEGGIFGHSNVAHVVQDEEVADLYLRYWNEVEKDLPHAEMRLAVEAITPTPDEALPPVGTSVLFSPRRGLEVLDWYAALAKDASEGLFMTFAFGMDDRFQDAYRTGAAPLRMALMEKAIAAMEAGPKRDAKIEAIQKLRNLVPNVFAIGNHIRTNKFDGWVREKLSGLNRNVMYVHNKFMLVDPLGDDPIVIAGSANFSRDSTNVNDENMLVVRGNTRVADLYLGEFARLYSHHAFRESLTFGAPRQPKPLDTGDWWTRYFGDTSYAVRRKYFARS